MTFQAFRGSSGAQIAFTILLATSIGDTVTQCTAHDRGVANTVTVGQNDKRLKIRWLENPILGLEPKFQVNCGQLLPSVSGFTLKNFALTFCTNFFPDFFTCIVGWSEKHKSWKMQQLDVPPPARPACGISFRLLLAASASCGTSFGVL